MATPKPGHKIHALQDAQSEEFQAELQTQLLRAPRILARQCVHHVLCSRAPLRANQQHLPIHQLL